MIEGAINCAWSKAKYVVDALNGAGDYFIRNNL